MTIWKEGSGTQRDPSPSGHAEDMEPAGAEHAGAGDYKYYAVGRQQLSFLGVPTLPPHK